MNWKRILVRGGGGILALLVLLLIVNVISSPSDKSTKTAGQKPATTAECPGKQMLLALSEELEDITNGGKCSLVAQINNNEEVLYSVDKVHEYKPNGWATPDPVWVRGTRKGLLIQASLCPPRVEKRNFDCTPRR